MSKRRRSSPPGHQERVSGAQDVRSEAHGHGAEVGNQAAQHVLESPETPGLDVVRDVALPGIKHAQVALELRAMPQDALDRLVGIVERSGLDEVRRVEMADRIRSGQEAAFSVGRALSSTFGVEDSPEARDQVVDLLHGISGALQSGTAEGDSWMAGGACVEVPLEGSLRERADRLLIGLTEVVSPGSGQGESVAALCRTVQLAVILDEEEEEEGPVPGAYAEEESGW